MRRREFITLLGGAAAWPRRSSAQQQVPVIGFLGGASPGPWAHFVAAFRAGLKEAGFTEGQNVAITFRWAEGQYDRLPELAADLVRSPVDLLAATGGLPATMAAKAATTTIPIVFTLGADPVAMGIVPSLNRPGGNITGAFLFTATIDAKRFGLLADMAPGAALTAVLLNPKNPDVAARLNDIEAAARSVGKRLQFVHASTAEELEAVFASLRPSGAGALLVGAEPFFSTTRNTIVALAARHAIPAIYGQREFAVAGGLMSYGPDFAASYRHAGIYAGRILKGEKPSDLPVVQSTKFELVINLKTAKALGIEVPPGVSAQADEVIE